MVLGIFRAVPPPNQAPGPRPIDTSRHPCRSSALRVAHTTEETTSLLTTKKLPTLSRSPGPHPAATSPALTEAPHPPKPTHPQTHRPGPRARPSLRDHHRSEAMPPATEPAQIHLAIWNRHVAPRHPRTHHRARPALRPGYASCHNDDVLIIHGAWCSATPGSKCPCARPERDIDGRDVAQASGRHGVLLAGHGALRQACRYQLRWARRISHRPLFITPPAPSPPTSTPTSGPWLASAVIRALAATQDAPRAAATRRSRRIPATARGRGSATCSPITGRRSVHPMGSASSSADARIYIGDAPIVAAGSRTRPPPGTPSCTCPPHPRARLPPTRA